MNAIAPLAERTLPAKSVDLEKALAHYRRALKRRLHTRGHRVPGTAAVQHLIATVLIELGRPVEAIPHAEAAVDYYQQVLAPGHPFRRQSEALWADLAEHRTDNVDTDEMDAFNMDCLELPALELELLGDLRLEDKRMTANEVTNDRSGALSQNGPRTTAKLGREMTRKSRPRKEAPANLRPLRAEPLRAGLPVQKDSAERDGRVLDIAADFLSGLATMSAR